MDGPRDFHTKCSNQREKDIYHMASLICGLYHMIQMNLSTKQKHTLIENRLVITKGERERDELGVWVSRNRLSQNG